MYHPPAIGALSRRFPDKRSFAISLHGSGGSVGEVAGPLLTAGLLTYLTWEGILQISMLPAIVCAFLVWRVMGGLEFADGGGSTLKAYFQSLAVMLRKKALALLVLITALRAMGQSSISLFLPVYLREDLDYSAATVGIFLSMAQLVGIGSQPIMGYLSDRIGHKKVLVPAMLCLAALFAALAFAEGDVQLAVTILLLGAFLYSLHSIFISAAIGVVGENGQSTVVSVMYGASFLGVLSPIIAGLIVDETQTQNAFLYGAVMVLLGAIVLAVMKLPRGEPVAHAH
jgi:MFS family permease